MIVATLILLGTAASGFFFRALRGPSLADRVLAIEGMIVTGIRAIAVRAMQTGDGAFRPILFVFTLVGFVGTSAAARFIEGRR
jgi:multicomponent Na+:H+ antiporter subunit F